MKKESKEDMLVRTVEENLLKIQKNLNMRKSLISDINERISSGKKAQEEQQRQEQFLKEKEVFKSRGFSSDLARTTNTLNSGRKNGEQPLIGTPIGKDYNGGSGTMKFHVQTYSSTSKKIEQQFESARKTNIEKFASSSKRQEEKFESAQSKAKEENLWQEFEDYNEENEGSFYSSGDEGEVEMLSQVKCSIFDKDCSSKKPNDKDLKNKLSSGKKPIHFAPEGFAESNSSIKSNAYKDFLDIKSSCREIDINETSGGLERELKVNKKWKKTKSENKLFLFIFAGYY